MIYLFKYNEIIYLYVCSMDFATIFCLVSIRLKSYIAQMTIIYLAGMLVSPWLRLTQAKKDSTAAEGHNILSLDEFAKPF